MVYDISFCVDVRCWCMYRVDLDWKGTSKFQNPRSIEGELNSSYQIGQHFVHSTSPTEHLREIRADQRRNLERERQERRLKLEIESHKQSTNDDANNGDKGHETFGDKQEKHSSSDRRQEKTEEFQGKGGVKPGGGGEPIREEMRSKPITITIHKDQDLNYGNETRPEPSEEKKANFMPMPEGK